MKEKKRIHFLFMYQSVEVYANEYVVDWAPILYLSNVENFLESLIVLIQIQLMILVFLANLSMFFHNILLYVQMFYEVKYIQKEMMY